MQASVTIPGRNVKLFAKALGAIAKIGNEVVVEFGDGVSDAARALGTPRDGARSGAAHKTPRAEFWLLFSFPPLPG